MELQFVELTSDKKPKHKFKDPKDRKTWDEVKDKDNVAMIIPDGYVVLDFDLEHEAKIMLDIIEGLNIQTKVMKTNRGIHVWFRSDDQMKNFILSRLAIGLHADCKSGVNGDKVSYVMIKRYGEMRDYIGKCLWKDVPHIPKWLKVVPAPADGKYDFQDMEDGDGRNHTLFTYIAYLQNNGFSRDEVKETIKIINKYILQDPLPQYELQNVLRDEAFLSDEKVEEQLMEKEGFQHNYFGDILIDTFNIITVNDQMFVYENGYYQQDERIIEQKMIELFPAIKNFQRNEVLSYIKIQTHRHGSDLKVNPYIINLQNTRMDIRTGKLLEFTPEAIEFDRIPVDYNPDAYSPELDAMLNRVFLGDKDVLKLFDEMVGYMLLKNNRYRSGFMLYGHGRNGKSTILNLLKRFIGDRNYSTIELDKLADRFATAELEHKLVNIGDDINAKVIKDTGTIKKLFTGESVQVERKGQDPFTLKSYAKMIFSMNEIPRSYDKSEGFYSRLMFIPFNARFQATDADFDPDIEDKITTDEALSYLLNRALKGVNRLIDQGGFTQPKVVQESMDEYREENSLVRMWVKDDGLEVTDLVQVRKDELHSMFQDWSSRAGYRDMGRNNFYKEVKQEFDLVDVQRRVGTKRMNVFEMNLD